ncbi:MAG: HPr(Ser) kinase/phosphatase [Candidatus Marinimicrobia bacterium]|nr:HPr(Ser) kinase/phosphatase [Candidatus Neomarinimicrobiota bacterium]
MIQEPLTVGRLYKDNKKKLRLRQLNCEIGRDRLLKSYQLNRPGLELAGHWEYFDEKRIQVFGLKEKKYFDRLNEEEIGEIFKKLVSYNIPAIIFAHSTKPPIPEILDMATKRNIGVFATSITTSDIIAFLMDYLDWNLAPSSVLHGSLVDVYGVGILLTGRSGIGKSEITLDLVERGHRLVADDLVKVIRRADNVLIGMGLDFYEHQIEIRGVGIVDVSSMFGIRAIRKQKRVEVQVELEDWSKLDNYERIGTSETRIKILDVEIPLVKLPIYPGKNITVIIEVIAMNHLLKTYGKYMARDFEKKLFKKLQQKARDKELKQYFKKDFE